MAGFTAALRRPARTTTGGGGPLADASFRLLVGGQFASNVGDYCYAVALPWLILSGRGGAVLLGTVLACFGVARAVAIPLGGVLADRFGGRRIMLLTDAARAAAVAVLAALSFGGPPGAAQLIPIALVLGVGSGLFLPASFTVLPALLPKDQLGRGNALSVMANQVGGLLGPAAGGALVATAGAASALAVDAFSFLASAASLFAMRRVRAADRTATAKNDPANVTPTPTAGPSFTDVLRHGRLLHVVLAVALVCNLAFNGTIEVALPDFAHQDIGAAGYGILLTVLSLGALGGSLLATRISSIRTPAYLFAGLAVVMGLGLAALPYAGGLVGAAVCIALYSVASGWQNIVAVTMLQVWTPSALVGKVMSLVMLAVTGTFPISVAVAGFGVRRLGAAPFFPVAGAAIAAAVLLALTQKAFRDYRTGDEYAAPPPDPAPLPMPTYPASVTAQEADG